MGKNLIILLSLALALALAACCNTRTKITYSYNGTVIRRVDKCGKTIFYYTKIDKGTSRIWVEYSGINDGFSGYLKFDDNGKVSILSGDGYFQSSNIDTSKFVYKRIIAHQKPNLGEDVYFIQLSTRYEQEKNRNTGTKVKVTYNDDITSKNIIE